jgi:rhodanese-related sulfurtransferase
MSTTIDPGTTPTRISPEALATILDQGGNVRVLDVRTPGEFEGVHISGSYNVPLDTLGEHATEIRRHVEETVVVVCRSGARASQAEQRLNAAGMTNVKVLEGGIVAWEATLGDQRGRLNRGTPRWDLERQVRLVAGAIVLAGIVASVWFPAARFVSGAIGLGLTVAALTNTCAMGMMLSKLPYNRGASCDVDAVVAQLTGPR